MGGTIAGVEIDGLEIIRVASEEVVQQLLYFARVPVSFKGLECDHGQNVLGLSFSVMCMLNHGLE